MANPVQNYFAESGDTPSALAQRMGKAPSTLTRYLKGEREPSYEAADEIARAAGDAFTGMDFIAACYEASKAREADDLVPAKVA